MNDFHNRPNTDRGFDEFYNNTFNNNDYNNINIGRNYINKYNQSKNNSSKKYTTKTIIVYLFFIVMALVLLVLMGTILSLSISATNEPNPVKKQQLVQMTMYIFFCIFTFAGFGLLTYSIVDKKRKLKRCNHLIKATVVGYKNRASINHEKLYAESGQKPCVSPEYEFFYMGENYHVIESSARNFALPTIGSQIDMFINEEDPYDFYIEKKTGNLIIGFLFFAIGIGGLIYIFFWINIDLIIECH